MRHRLTWGAQEWPNEGRTRIGAVTEGARHQSFTTNPNGGADWAVGDIHGCFSMLETALGEAGFDGARDRLFSVGDLIDRGMESKAALQWLTSGRIKCAVRGNHEQFLIDALASEFDAKKIEKLLYDDRDLAAGCWMQNGGTWWYERPRTHNETEQWLNAFAALPHSISVATQTGTIAIIHAQPTHSSWAQTIKALEGDRVSRCRAQWSRKRYGLLQPEIGEEERDWAGGCDDVRNVIVGHTPRRNAERHGNVLNIDTGAFKQGGVLTLARFDCDPIRLITQR